MAPSRYYAETNKIYNSYGGLIPKNLVNKAVTYLLNSGQAKTMKDLYNKVPKYALEIHTVARNLMRLRQTPRRSPKKA